jgi:hypothetical protein
VKHQLKQVFEYRRKNVDFLFIDDDKRHHENCDRHDQCTMTDSLETPFPSLQDVIDMVLSVKFLLYFYTSVREKAIGMEKISI